MTTDGAAKADTAFRPRVFLTTLIGVLAIIFIAQLTPLKIDVFDDKASSARSLLDGLSASDIASLKKLHAEQTVRYSVGLFGNSRILDVSDSDVGKFKDGLFNFAITGSSIRQTVAFLEALADLDKIPRVVVVSLDNFELQLFANPEYPHPPMRWKLLLSDLNIALFTPNVALADRTKIAWRWAHDEWVWFVGLFNVKRLLNRVTVGTEDRGEARQAAYRIDGSREPPATIRSPDILAPGPRMFIDRVFDADLARLSAIGRRGVRIIIYESPLEPRSAEAFKRSPSPFATDLRSRMAQSSDRMGFEWYPASGWLDDGRMSWRDSNHPPVPALGLYIATLIGNAGNNERRE